MHMHLRHHEHNGRTLVVGLIGVLVIKDMSADERDKEAMAVQECNL